MAIQSKVPGTTTIKVSSTGRTTHVKEVKVGTPIRRVTGAVNTIYNLSGIDTTGQVDGQSILVYDSASGNYVAKTVLPGSPDSGTYGSTTQVPVLTVNEFGIIDSIGTQLISTTLNTIASNGTGTVNLIDSSLSILGGGLLRTTASDNSITISLDSTGVLAGSYGSASQIPVFSVNAQGLIESAGTVAVAGVSSLVFDSATRNLTINTADGDSHTTMISTVNGESGTYGSASLIPVLTVNRYGEVDSIGEVSVAGVSSVAFDSASHVLTINTADGNSFPTMIQTRIGGAGTFGSASLVPIVSVNEYGLIDSVSTTSIGGINTVDYDSNRRVLEIATSDGTLYQTHISSPIMQIAGDTGTDNHHVGDSAPLTFSGGTGVSTQVNDNEVVINIGQPVATTDSVKFSALHVTGDLVVSGTQTTFNSQSLTIKDPLIHLADSNMEDVLDIGFMGHYYQDGQHRKTGLFRDASNERYYLFSNLVDSSFDSSPAPATINRVGTDFVTSHLHLGRLTLDSADNGVYNGGGYIDLPARGRLRFAKVFEQFYDDQEDISHIRDSSGRGLLISGSNVTIRRSGDNEPFAVFSGDSATSLYYNGEKRITTGIYGARVRGILNADSADITQFKGEWLGFDSAVTALDTDRIAEGTNLYFLPERVDDRVSQLVKAGTAVNVSYNDSGNLLTWDNDIATADSLGVASFSNTYFDVTLGAVALKNDIVFDAGTF